MVGDVLAVVVLTIGIVGVSRHRCQSKHNQLR
jgi:hypothetical protein